MYGTLLNNIRQDPTETWYTWDFSKPEVGELWIEACRNMTDSGVIDGCFMDGCANWDHSGRVDGKLTVPGPLDQAVHDAYAQNKPAWMRRLQQQVPGIMICGSNGGFLDGVAATQVQNWGVHDQDYAGHWIPMLQRSVAAGKVFQAHAACGSSDPYDPIEQTKLAAFLVAAGDRSYYMCGGWGAAKVDWFPIYDLPLGKPLGNATLGPDGVYVRHFASGTVATFDTSMNNGTIQWASAPISTTTPPPVSRCPASHPWAYRPKADFDYCCASSEDKYGHVGINSQADRDSRANSCKDDDYFPCEAKPCLDYTEAALV